jgi:hypothetical protein
MSGLYRQAFAGLRSFLEVTAGATYLSALEFRRRQWVSGILDISWSAITSKDDGLYSPAFLKEFCPEATEEREVMLEGLKRAYRRCSEYVHGNVSTTQMLPTDISYREEVAKEWLAVATSALTATIHFLMVRYYKDLPETGRRAVEGSLEEHFSHLVSARKLLDLPLEDNPT